MRDCVVVGAGASGLSGALVLGRAQRSTLVVDAGSQSNLASEAIGGLLGNDHRAPGDFYAGCRAELERYPAVELREGEVTGAERDGDGFVVTLSDGSTERSRRILLATGMDYRAPDIEGVEGRWGRSVFHCPFCHGWEHRGKVLGVLDDGSSGVDRAVMLRAWSDKVTLYTNGQGAPDRDSAERLENLGIALEERPIAALRGEAPDLASVDFTEGEPQACEGMLVPVTLHQRSGLAHMLEAEAAEPGHLSEETLEVDATAETTARGVFAAGDLTTQAPSVPHAIASGTAAGGVIVRDLMDEDSRRGSR